MSIEKVSGKWVEESKKVHYKGYYIIITYFLVIHVQGVEKPFDDLECAIIYIDNEIGLKG